MASHNTDEDMINHAMTQCRNRTIGRVPLHSWDVHPEALPQAPALAIVQPKARSGAYTWATLMC